MGETELRELFGWTAGAAAAAHIERKNSGPNRRAKRAAGKRQRLARRVNR